MDRFRTERVCWSETQRWYCRRPWLWSVTSNTSKHLLQSRSISIPGTLECLHLSEPAFTIHLVRYRWVTHTVEDDKPKTPEILCNLYPFCPSDGDVGKQEQIRGDISEIESAGETNHIFGGEMCKLWHWTSISKSLKSTAGALLSNTMAWSPPGRVPDGRSLWLRTRDSKRLLTAKVHKKQQWPRQKQEGRSGIASQKPGTPCHNLATIPSKAKDWAIWLISKYKLKAWKPPSCW